MKDQNFFEGNSVIKIDSIVNKDEARKMFLKSVIPETNKIWSNGYILLDTIICQYDANHTYRKITKHLFKVLKG